MDIKFKRIEMHNFMSFADEAFDFGSCIGMNLVQGKNNDIPGSKNGSGKSNLYSSLLYVLFGQLQAKIKNENIVNKAGDSKDMVLALSLSVDGQDYKIRRGLEKGKTSYLEVLKLDNGTEVDITKSTIAETQEFIERDLIHCDVTMFLRTILLTADQSYNFYMLKKADKKEFVEKMFDIGVFEDMYKAIHKDNLALDKESIASQNRLMVYNKTLEDYVEKSKKSEESKKIRMKVIQEEIGKLEIELEAAKKVEVKTNAETAKKLEDAIEKLRDEYDSSKEQLLETSSKSSQIELGMHKIDESMKSRQKMIDKHKDILEKLCNDCKPIFMKHYSLDTLMSEMEDMDKKKILLESSKKDLDKKIASIKDRCNDSKTKIAKAKDKLQKITEESNKASKIVSGIESRIRDSRNSLEILKSNPDPYVELIAECKSNIDGETKKISKIETKSRYLKYAENIVSQDTIRKFIIKDLVVLLNNKIKTYLTKLGARYYVEFDEDMDYEFISPNGSYEWSNFSAGERMRIMIATSFAFRDFMSIRNGLNANILILDEYFDSAIDTLCVESILNILKEYSERQNQNIFVISHRPEVSQDAFDRTILVEKTAGISKVEVNSH